MAHVQTRSGRVRELYKRVKLGLGEVILCAERARLLPDPLPLALYFGGIVLFRHEYGLLRRARACV